MPIRNWTDQKIENVLGNLLRAGVLLSALVVAVGAAIYLFKHGRSAVEFQVFRAEPEEFRNIAGIIGAALAGRGRGIIQLGLLLLIATPVARVGFSILGFAAERDRLYVAFTIIVFAVLLYGFFGVV